MFFLRLRGMLNVGSRACESCLIAFMTFTKLSPGNSQPSTVSTASTATAGRKKATPQPAC